MDTSYSYNSVYRNENEIAKMQQAFLNKVYSWMVVGLGITASVAYYTLESGLVYNVLNYMWILFFGTLGLVFVLSGAINKLSSTVASALFIAYSALTGVTFSTIALVYSGESIANVFFITAGSFAALSFYGYTTKKDLSGMGRFMFMGLVGIIIASIVNWFMASSMLHTMISIIGVIVFAGLTAYDTQKLKEMYEVQLQGNEIASKAAIIGALTLYLDFINLFLFLLRFLGGSRD